MTANTSKQSSDREKAARFVLAALLHRGQEIGNLLLDLFLPHRAEGDPEPAFTGCIVAIGRKVKDAIDRVIAADNRLFAANAALDAARRSRDKSASSLSRQIIGLRGACNALYVNLPVQQLGFDLQTAQDPVPLLIQADRVVESLDGAQVSESELLFEDDDFDPGKYAQQVGQKAKQLRQDLDRVAEARRRVEEVLLAKRAVTQEYDDLFLHGARTFESYCRLAGKNDLADRVRPSETSPGRTEVKPDDVPESDPESPAAGAGEEGANESPEAVPESEAPRS